MRTSHRCSILLLALSASVMQTAAVAEDLKVTVYESDQPICNFLFPLDENQGLDKPLSLRSGKDVPIAKPTNPAKAADHHTVPVGCRGELRTAWMSPPPGGNGLRRLYVKTDFTYSKVTGSDTFEVAGQSYDQPRVILFTTRNERTIGQEGPEVIASNNAFRLVAEVTH